MSRNARQHGFSLIETLLAVATLAIGLLFVGGTFMTAVYFSTISTERTIGSVAADEAFAKIKLYGLNPNAIDPVRLYDLDPNEGDPAFIPYVPYESLTKNMPWPEYLYPSTRETTTQYSWAAICRRMPGGGRLVQVTVFVCRESGVHSLSPRKYWVRKTGARWPSLDPNDPNNPGNLPRPVRVSVVEIAGSPNEIQIVDKLVDGVDERAFINDGASIVDDATGQIYRVLRRSPTQPDRITLDRPWIPAVDGGVWVVPPAISGGRSSLVAVFQQVLRF